LKIIPATPTSIVGLLNMIHFAWRRNELADNTLKISQLASVHLNNLNAMFDAVKRLGNSLGTSLNAFNDVASRLDNTVLGSAKRLRALGVSVNQELPSTIEPVEKSVREIGTSPEVADIQEIETEEDE
jgi:DNA recombination protein RmuC